MERTSRSYELALPITKLQVVTQCASEFGHSDGMRFRVSIPGVKGLSREIQRLILQYCLPLDVRNRAPHSQNKTKEARRDHVADWIGLRIEQQVEDPSAKFNAIVGIIAARP